MSGTMPEYRIMDRFTHRKSVLILTFVAGLAIVGVVVAASISAKHRADSLFLKGQLHVLTSTSSSSESMNSKC